MTALDAALLDAVGVTDTTASKTFCASVPARTHRVVLAMTQDGYTQHLDLWTLRRVGPAPAILYRAQTGGFSVAATSTATTTLPVSAPTGAELPVHVSASAAVLSTFRPLVTGAATTPPPPGAAYLDVELLGTYLAHPGPATHGAYVPYTAAFPTPLPASRLTFTPEGGKPVTATELPAAGTRGGYDTGLFHAWYVFNVPEATTAGTLAVAPGPCTGQVCALVGCSPTETLALGAARIALRFPAPPSVRPAQKRPPRVGAPLPPTGAEALGAAPRPRGAVASVPSSGFPLMELEVRRAMAHRHIDSLALYPEEHPSTAPSAQRMIEVFTGVARHRLFDAEGTLVQTFAPVITLLQEQLLDLLGVPASVYA